MKNDITIFKSEDFGAVRTMVIGNEPWFVGKDVAQILGYSNPRDAVTKRVDADDKGVANCDTPGGVQKVVVINESGLYSLILSSKLPNAKDFKRWVTSEILPSIRKHGMYVTEDLLANPDLAIAAFTALKEEREKNALLTKTNQALVKETTEWDNRKLLSALIRQYGAVCCGGQFSTAWRRFYKVLLYKKGICVNSRTQVTGNRIDTLSDEEMKDAVQVAVAMCIEDDVQIDELLSHMPDSN